VQNSTPDGGTCRRNVHQNPQPCELYCAQVQKFCEDAIMAVSMMEEVSGQVPADDFQALEEKVYRTIEMYKSAREAKATVERDAKRLREQLEERGEEIESMRREMVRLRKEREEIKSRVEKMMQRIDTLAEEAAAS